MNQTSWYGLKAVAGNLPMPRAGVYSITNIEMGMTYIGISANVAKRVREHTRRASRGSKISSAILAFGPEKFLIKPLFYSLDGSDGLEKIEADLISIFDSIDAGYNVLASSKGAGPYGAAFAQSVSRALNTPEAKAARALRLADAQITQRRADAIRAAHARPEAKARLKARRRSPITPEGIERLRSLQLALNANPEFRARKSSAMAANHANAAFKQKHLEGVRKACADPARASKISASRKGGMWITDGANQSFVRAGSEIPSGWYRGRPKRS